jgi:hypothetical protein
VQASPVQTVQTSPGPADETKVPDPLPTTVQACAGGATATGAAPIAAAADMPVTSHAASFFISYPFCWPAYRKYRPMNRAGPEKCAS